MLTPLLALTLLTSSASTPTEVVKQGNAEVERVVSGKDASPDRLARVADTFLDFAELARRALGAEWAKLTAKQQAEFSTTMRGLLRASYAQRALVQGKTELKFGAEKVTHHEAEVATTLTFAGDELPVIYRLHKSADAAPWKIYDVVTDDISLVDTYRDQFRKVIAEKGVAGLLTTLKAKRDQLEKTVASSTARN